MNGHVNEQRAENEQVCPVINGVLNQCRFDLPGDGEASGASVRLHEGQQQPDDTRKPLKHKNSACGGFMRRLGLVLTTWGTETSSTPPSRTLAWCHQGCSSTACGTAFVHWEETQSGVQKPADVFTKTTLLLVTFFVTHSGLSKKSRLSFKVHLLKFNKKESLQILLCLLLWLSVWKDH